MPRPTADDVQLILRLYELRRDPEMRRARAFMLTEFNPKTWDEVRAHYLTGDEVDRHFRMATSYWEMVATFVNKRLLDEDLFVDTHGEDMVVWKKVEPIIADARKSIRPTWLWNLEMVAKRHLAWRQQTFKTAAKVIEAGSKLRKKSAAK